MSARDKRPYLAIARISSDEQADGFSLEVQDSRIREHAERKGIALEQVFKIIESASVSEKRTRFHAILDSARKEAHRLGGIMFVSVDRATRNPEDLFMLLNLEQETGLRVDFLDGDFDAKTALGELFLTMQGTIARFQVRTQGEKIRASMARRAQEGYFISHPPLGYRLTRLGKHSEATVDPGKAEKVLRIFDLYATGKHTLESVSDALLEEGVIYTAGTPRFRKKHIHEILRNRSYIGEVPYQGEWYQGTHEALVGIRTFDRVQKLLGRRSYQKHCLVFSHCLVRCGTCDRWITGEAKEKTLRSGETRTYVYYRCSGYTESDHPMVRVTEDELNEQVLALFSRLHVDDAEMRDWFVEALRSRIREARAQVRKRQESLQGQLTHVRKRKQALVEGRLDGEFDSETYSAMSCESARRASSRTWRRSAYRSPRTRIWPSRSLN